MVSDLADSASLEGAVAPFYKTVLELLPVHGYFKNKNKLSGGIQTKMAFGELDRVVLAYALDIFLCLEDYMNKQTEFLVSVIRHELCRRRLILQAIAENESYLLRAGALLQQGKPRRSVWMKVRDRSFWERVVLKEYTDEDWRSNFRMTRRTFDTLCGLMSDVMKPEDVTIRTPIPLPMRVAIVLYKLANCAEYRVVANQFGIGKATVKKLVYLFCRGMVSSVISSIIRMPTAEEAIAIASRFEQKFHIPHIIGCIDGTHIPILPPTDGYRDFVNRKGWPSYVLQAVVDDKYRFWSLSCKQPGSAQDANVLKQSQLFSQAHLLPKGPREINGVTINHFLLGDSAYPLMDWLIKEYTHSPRITPEQESFNVYLSSARTTVEIAFGRLKSRWRVLMKQRDFHFTFSPYMIATCCALHNLCEDEKESVNPTWTADAAVLESAMPQPGVCAYNAPDSNAAGQRVRDALADYLSANFPLRTPLS